MLLQQQNDRQLCSFTGAAEQASGMKVLTFLPAVSYTKTTPQSTSLFHIKTPVLLAPPCFCVVGAQETVEEERLEMSTLPCIVIFNFLSRAIFKQLKGLVFLFVLHQFGYFSSFFFALFPYFLVASICWVYFIYFGRMFCWGVGFGGVFFFLVLFVGFFFFIAGFVFVLACLWDFYLFI